MDVVSPKGPSSAEAVGRHGLKAGCQGEQSRSKSTQPSSGESSAVREKEKGKVAITNCKVIRGKGSIW